MLEDQRLSLGLPSFIPDVWADCQKWNLEIYEFVREWQLKKGFDPATTEFARSLGIPIMRTASPI